MLGAYRVPGRAIRRARTRARTGTCSPGCWEEKGYCVCPEDLVTLGAITKQGAGTFVDFTRFAPALSPGIAPGALPSVPSTTDPSAYLTPGLTEPPFWTPARIAIGTSVGVAATLLGFFLVRR